MTAKEWWDKVCPYCLGKGKREHVYPRIADSPFHLDGLLLLGYREARELERCRTCAGTGVDPKWKERP